MKIFPAIRDKYALISQSLLACHHQIADFKATADICSGAAGVNDELRLITFNHNGGRRRSINLADPSGTDNKTQIADGAINIFKTARF